MSEAKHTPVHWVAFSDVVNNHTNILKISKTTDLLFSLPDHDKHDPNVRLITAAPDLLEALEKAVADYGNEGGPWNVASEPGAWIKMAKSALAKARGEQS